MDDGSGFFHITAVGDKVLFLLRRAFLLINYHALLLNKTSLHHLY